MKTKLLTAGLFAFLAVAFASAQDVTTVNARNSDISDNLDLRAVASIFGDSKDLADFERRLNDPKLQISNLDLNNDNMVDYLRVIESVENNTHVIVLQAVIGRDLYQDVATIEVERDDRNRVQVQVVGNVYMYGSNYIYEPVYVSRPMIYNTFWVRNYRPYYSTWYYNYYPSYYYAWTPYPVYRYHQNVHYHINTNNYYYYADTRKSQRAIAMHRNIRGNAYETQHPNRSFTQRTNVNNRRELASVNTTNTTRTPAVASTRTESSGNNQGTIRSQETVRNTAPAPQSNTVRSTTTSSSTTVQPTRNAGVTRSTSVSDRSQSAPIVRENTATTRSNTASNYSAPTRSNTTSNYTAPTRSAATSAPSTRVSSARDNSSSTTMRSTSAATSRSNVSQNAAAQNQRSASQSISRR